MPTGQPPRCRWSRGPRAGSPGSGARRSGSGTWLAAPVRLLVWLQLHGEREGPRWLPGVLPSGRAGHERTLVLCAESQPQACRAQGTAFCVHSCLIPGPWCPRPPSLPDPLQETQGTVVNFAPKRGRDRRRMSPLLRRPSQTARRRGPQGLNHSATAELPTLPGKGSRPPLGAGLQLEGGLSCPQWPERLSATCPRSEEASRSPETDLTEPLASPQAAPPASSLARRSVSHDTSACLEGPPPTGSQGP